MIVEIINQLKHGLLKLVRPTNPPYDGCNFRRISLITSAINCLPGIIVITA